MKRQYHPNGFWVRTLVQFWNGARLRLHTWPANRGDRSDPHDHRTWFISIPLWGRFTEYRYKEIAGDVAVFRCRVTTAAERMSIVPDGKSDVTVLGSKTRYPLVPYYCPKEVIHSYAPKHVGFAASIVLFGPPTDIIPRAWIRSK